MNGMCYPTTGAMCATCKQRENSEIARALVERIDERVEVGAQLKLFTYFQSRSCCRAGRTCFIQCPGIKINDDRVDLQSKVLAQPHAPEERLVVVLIGQIVELCFRVGT